MRIAVVSDIHSNLVALRAVLEDMGTVDAIWCLGDFVGYGPRPNECVALLRERGASAIAGNHDLAVVGAISTDEFNIEAARAADWTAQELTPESRGFLADLTPTSTVDGVTLAHGSPREPIWEYVLDSRAAQASFNLLDTKLCFIGHSHIPSAFVEAPTKIVVKHMTSGSHCEVSEYKMIVNPGSVGQPRDHDPRAAYLIYDTDAAAMEWRRVPYDIAETQRQMRKAGLPRYFVERLSFGS
ncbi:MAG TPA: metallophosphoesterase family protein [Chloroflexota bacterium]|nr:metallophosphoesterase family protein [Chloroflexota bacterium]